MSVPGSHLSTTDDLRLADVVREGMPDLLAQYGNRLSDNQQRALRAITVCRTPACGSLLMRCGDCGHDDRLPRSCGHRSCPACQHHTTGQWLDRQTAKLLPVDYFMVTFTLPAALRGVASCHSKAVFTALFDAASDTLKTFGHRHKLGINMGLCAVLHTHARNLDFHPHVHLVVPGAACITNADNGVNSRIDIYSMPGLWPRSFEPRCWTV